MKTKAIILSLLMILSLESFAKKDIEAWKQEKTLKSQFEVFKQNLNFWNDYYSFKEYQFADLYKAVNDSVSNLQNTISENRKDISNLNSQIKQLEAGISQTKQKLDQSLEREDSFVAFGLAISKTTFAIIMYSLTGILLAALIFLGIMFNQNNQATKEAKDKFEDLYKEFENHKKNNLDRVTKLNKDLHDARMKLGEL